MITLKPIDFDIEILGYGPVMDLNEDGYGILTPQQVIALSSMMTYKSKNAREIALEALKSEQDLDQKIVNSIINSVGRGHASLSTSAALWCLFTGSSKFVDSLFTGAIFSSSLMPSGRRIPVNIESILAPESVIKADEETKKIYYETSKSNIEFYEFLLSKNVSKEEAAKITHYGLTGGGFILLSLETILAYKREFELEKDFIPKEGHDFIKKIEEQLKYLGMDILYWARNFAPRNTLPYPNIFTDPNKPSFINDLQQRFFGRKEPTIIFDYHYDSNSFREELIRLHNLEKEITSNPESVIERWQELLQSRRDLVKRYKDVLSFSSFSNVSWRVWGEVKRHRTLDQSVESVYHAVDRAERIYIHREQIQKGELSDKLIEDISSAYVIPDGVLKDTGLTKMWLKRVLDSIEAYNKLKKYIPISDALAIIPRGLKLSIYKRFNLFNILDGYIPLRLCGTAEPEMRKTTELEAEFIKKSSPNYLSNLIGPKCRSVGFCLEPFKSYCGNINHYVNFKYNKEFHEEIHKKRRELIENNIKIT